MTEHTDEETAAPEEVRETAQPEPPTAPPAPPAPTAPTEPTEPTEPGNRLEPRDPRALTMEMAAGGLFIAIATLIAFAAATLLLVFASLSPWLFLAAAAFPLVLCFPVLVIPRWQHRRYRYRADSRGLEIHQGVWWRSRRFIPKSRLQHTDVTQGPLERRFGVANLVVHTAGTHEARTTVSGLSLETARQVRDRLTGESEVDADGV